MKKFLLLSLLGFAIAGIFYTQKNPSLVIEGQKENLQIETQTPPPIAEKETTPPPEPEPPKPAPSITLTTNTPEQGDTIGIKIEHASSPSVTIGKEKIPLIKTSDGFAGIYGIDARESPKTQTLTFFENKTLISEKTITIQKRNFPVTQLVLSETQKDQGETPETAVQNIIQNDNAKLYEVLDAPGDELFISTSFELPLPNQIIVGAFGNIRKSGETEIRHLGTDLDGRRGDPVYAINDGKIRLGRSLTNYGNTVIIDHGASIFSLYLHLDSITAETDQIVQKGDIIGTIGNTGAYSLDPHLHLSIKANGASVDPLRFIKNANSVLN